MEGKLFSIIGIKIISTSVVHKSVMQAVNKKLVVALTFLIAYVCYLLVYTHYISRKEKELRKALETPEEKRARRLAKKEAKERKRRQKLGWDSEQLVDNNPQH